MEVGFTGVLANGGRMGLLFGTGSPTTELQPADLQDGLATALQRLGPARKILAVPPDITRLHSRAGLLTKLAYKQLGPALTDVLPALGTHKPMDDAELATMFGGVPRHLFRVHDWRHDVVAMGEVPGEFLHMISDGLVSFPWPAEVNRLVAHGGHDLILSIGQVVPHEVAGMANGAKNIFIGTGGPLAIHRSHFLGAVYGMERMMGRVDTPVRRVLRYASEHFAHHLPLVYIQTVVAKTHEGRLVTRGLFVSEDETAFERAAALSLQCNFVRLPKTMQKAVVYLDPTEFRSTWLGNKGIYRTRMALADNAELIVLAPGVREFGEDATIDHLIRRHGYRGTPATLAAVKTDPELASNLSAAAHLIHGSSEGRFRIRYCPGHLSRAEVEGVGYTYGNIPEYLARYPPASLKDGWNLIDGEEVFFISNPGLGLWAYENRLQH